MPHYGIPVLWGCWTSHTQWHCEIVHFAGLTWRGWVLVQITMWGHSTLCGQYHCVLHLQLNWIQSLINSQNTTSRHNQSVSSWNLPICFHLSISSIQQPANCIQANADKFQVRIMSRDPTITDIDLQIKNVTLKSTELVKLIGMKIEK